MFFLRVGIFGGETFTKVWKWPWEKEEKKKLDWE